MKRALVLGGAGPVGSSLSESLLSDGWSVRCVDNELFLPTEIHKKNLNDPNFEYLNFDVADLSYQDVAGEQGGVDIVYNFCGPARYSYYRKYPVITATSQILSTRLSIEVARRQNCRLVFASSSEVYGSDASLLDRMNEDHPLHFPFSYKRSVYSGAKFTSERATQSVDGIDAIILRLFNVYGAAASIDDDRVIPLFVRNLQEGIPLPLDGDGCQIRSFIYIDDAIDIIRKVSEHHSPMYRIYNIGNPEPTSIANLISRISAISGKECVVNVRDAELDEVRVRVPDIRRVSKEFMWSPSISLEEGLRKCLRTVI